MGNWYKVTKRINGRLYDYWQRTERKGKSVKTFNKYIGPQGSTAAHVVGRYDELAHKADELYTYGNSLPWDHPDKRPAIDRYHHAFDAVSQYQADTLGRPIDVWGNAKGSGGGQMYRRSFVTEARELANRNDAESDGEKAVEDANFTDDDARWLERHLDTTFKQELQEHGVEVRDKSNAEPLWHKEHAMRSSPGANDDYERTVAEHRNYLARADYTPPTPEPPENERTAYDELSAGERHEIRALQREQKREFDAGMKRQAAKVRAAKRQTRGIKASNPFVARALGKKPFRSR